MEEDHSRSLKLDQRGIALLLVLAALTLLLPLALLISNLAFARQRQVAVWRHSLTGQFMARGAFDQAMRQLRSGEIRLRPEETTQITLTFDRPVQIVVTRDSDAVLTIEGDVLRGLATSRVDLKQMGVGADGRRVPVYRRLEVYLVEAEVAGGAGFPAVRLLGGLGRLDDGEVISLGYRLDRGYY